MKEFEKEMLKNALTISNEEYRNREGISKSALFKITKSPAHFKYAMENPQKDTPALLFGRAVHKYILEREDFEKEFAIAPNVNRRTKAGKEEYEAFLLANEGKDVISQDDYDKIVEMANAIDNNKIASRLLQGVHEKSYFWEDDLTGEICKCRPDNITKIGDTYILVDYKTTDDADGEAFMRSALKFGYDLQVAMYSEGMTKNTDKDFEFFFVCQEKTAPYVVNVLQASDTFKAEGKQLFHALLDIYHECKVNNDFPGYMGSGDNINTLNLPKWLQKEFE